jgi:hypothetical protein
MSFKYPIAKCDHMLQRLLGELQRADKDLMNGIMYNVNNVFKIQICII